MRVHDDHLDLLQRLGFTAYEAKAWLALVPEGLLTGYEVAKRSSVPRANIYPVLKRLLQRGAIRRVDTRDGPRYVATPADAMLESMQHEQRDLYATARASLPRGSTPVDGSQVYVLSTVDRARAAARAVIAGARDRLLIAVQPLESALLAPDVRAADGRGVQVTTLCLEACDSDCGGCCGTVHRCTRASARTGRWLVVSADDAAAVIAEFDGCGGVRAIEARQPLVVHLAATYVRQSAALGVLGEELGDRFPGWVSLEARRCLDDLQCLPWPGVRTTAAEPPVRDTARVVAGNTKEDSR